jgi:hypothetical protein
MGFADFATLGHPEPYHAEFATRISISGKLLA